MKSVKKAYFKCPIGYVEVTGTKLGIQTVTISDKKNKKWYVPRCLRETVSQLKEYFEGKRQTFTVKFDIMGTEFQMKVWEELSRVPYGKTITYYQLAEKIGDPKAFRAVGQADSKNPAWIIIPCHRVLGNDGKLVGYAGGLWRKKWLLEHEHAFAQKDLFY